MNHALADLSSPTVGPHDQAWNPVHQYQWIRYYLAINDWLTLLDGDQTPFTDVTWHPPHTPALLDLALQWHRGIGMQWLIEHGADVNAPLTANGDRPLHRAILHAVQYTQQIYRAIQRPMAIPAYPSTHMINLLILHGADPTRPNGQGQTSWDYAIQLGHWNALHRFAQP